MQTIFFILGRNPALSIAEVHFALDNEGISYSTILATEEVLVLSFESDFDILGLMKSLGGIIKIGKVVDEVTFEDDETKFDQILSAENICQKYLEIGKGKVHIGVSVYQAGGEPVYVAEIENRLKEINLTVKTNLKEKGIGVGFVQIKDRYLSSVSVAKNSLLTRGMEMVLLVTQKGISFGKTLAVQDFSSFSYRDYYRPGKDKKSGIMPPKLARMMINISGIRKNRALIDPFCGSGTVLSEAVFLGINKITGTDISDRAIADTNRNIDWIFTNFREVQRQNYDISIRKTDIYKLDKYFPAQSNDVIVTEPFLGPALHGRPNDQAAVNILNTLLPLYKEAVRQFSKILKKGGVVVMICPAFETSTGYQFLNIISHARELGLILKPLFAEKSQLKDYTDRETILVGDKFSFLKREIIKFVKI